MTVMFRQTIYGPILLDDARPVASFTDRLAPGVLGYSLDTPTGIYIGVISADTPGSGDVGRYLDSLPHDRRVVVPNVLSDRLAGMLERRGFVRGSEWSPEFQEHVDIWERPA